MDPERFFQKYQLHFVHLKYISVNSNYIYVSY